MLLELLRITAYSKSMVSYIWMYTECGLRGHYVERCKTLRVTLNEYRVQSICVASLHKLC